MFFSLYSCKPIRYMKGGHKSGFSHVEHVLKPRLMSVKGKHTPRIREVNGRCKIHDTCTGRTHFFCIEFASVFVCRVFSVFEGLSRENTFGNKRSAVITESRFKLIFMIKILFGRLRSPWCCT